MWINDLTRDSKNIYETLDIWIYLTLNKFVKCKAKWQTIQAFKKLILYLLTSFKKVASLNMYKIKTYFYVSKFWLTKLFWHKSDFDSKILCLKIGTTQKPSVE